MSPCDRLACRNTAADRSRCGRLSTVHQRCTQQDWRGSVAARLGGRYAGREKVTLVLDNLDAHTTEVFHEAFEPQCARALSERIDFRHTPQHGSQLNYAAVELSALSQQRLGQRRINNLDRVWREIAASSTVVGPRQLGADQRL